MIYANATIGEVFWKEWRGHFRTIPSETVQIIQLGVWQTIEAISVFPDKHVLIGSGAFVWAVIDYSLGVILGFAWTIKVHI